MRKTSRTFSLSQEALGYLESLAKQQDRSVSYILEKIVEYKIAEESISLEKLEKAESEEI